EKPVYNILKCNYDSGFDNMTGQVISGWIVRDHLGEAKYWGSVEVGGAHSPLETESKILIFAIQQIWI
ncbi:hypothetical protein CARUB_v10018801mg, partial [Capsella rubella]